MRFFSFFRTHITVLCLSMGLLLGVGTINLSNSVLSAQSNLNSQLKVRNRRQTKLMKSLMSMSALRVLYDQTFINRSQIRRFVHDSLKDNLGASGKEGFERFYFYDDSVAEYTSRPRSVVAPPERAKISLNPNLPFYESLTPLVGLINTDFFQRLLWQTEIPRHLGISSTSDEQRANEFKNFLSSREFALLVNELQSLDNNLELAKAAKLIFQLPVDQIMNEMMRLFFSGSGGFVEQLYTSFQSFMDRTTREFTLDQTILPLQKLINNNPQNMVREILRTIDLYIGSPEINDENRIYFTNRSDYGKIYRLLWYFEKEFGQTLAETTISEILQSEQTGTLADLKTFAEQKISDATTTSTKFVDNGPLIFQKVRDHVFKKVAEPFFAEVQNLIPNIPNLVTGSNPSLSWETVLFGTQEEEDNLNTNTDSTGSVSTAASTSLVNSFLKLNKLIIFYVISEEGHKNPELNLANKGTLSYFINAVLLSLKQIHFGYAHYAPIFDAMTEQISWVTPALKIQIRDIGNALLGYVRTHYLNKIDLTPTNTFLAFYEISLRSFSEIVNNDDFWQKITDKISSMKTSLKEYSYDAPSYDSDPKKKEKERINLLVKSTAFASVTRDLFNLVALVFNEMFEDEYRSTNISLDLIFGLLQRAFESTGLVNQFLNSHFFELVNLFLTKISFANINDVMQVLLFLTGKFLERYIWLRVIIVNRENLTLPVFSSMLMQSLNGNFSKLSQSNERNVINIYNKRDEILVEKPIFPVEINDGSFFGDIKNLLLSLQEKSSEETGETTTAETIAAPTLATEYGDPANVLPVAQKPDEKDRTHYLQQKFKASERTTVDSPFLQTVKGIKIPKSMTTSPSRYTTSAEDYKEMMNKFADFAYSFFSDSAAFFTAASHIVARALAQKFYFLMDYKNWDITDLEIDSALFESNTRSGVDGRGRVSYTARLFYEDELIYDFDFVWQVNTEEPRASLISMVNNNEIEEEEEEEKEETIAT